MGYFPNGTAGDDFERENCNKCVHEDDEKGCPVMLAHIFYAYELCNQKEHPGKVILDLLIVPHDEAERERTNRWQHCAMFVPRAGEPRKRP